MQRLREDIHDFTDQVFPNDRNNISIFYGSTYDGHKFVVIYCVKLTPVRARP